MSRAQNIQGAILRVLPALLLALLLPLAAAADREGPARSGAGPQAPSMAGQPLQLLSSLGAEILALSIEDEPQANPGPADLTRRAAPPGRSPRWQNLWHAARASQVAARLAGVAEARAPPRG